MISTQEKNSKYPQRPLPHHEQHARRRLLRRHRRGALQGRPRQDGQGEGTGET